MPAKTLSDSERNVIRAELIEATQLQLQLWSKMRDIEKVFGGDVDALPDLIENLAVSAPVDGGDITITDEFLNEEIAAWQHAATWQEEKYAKDRKD